MNRPDFGRGTAKRKFIPLRSIFGSKWTPDTRKTSDCDVGEIFQHVAMNGAMPGWPTTKVKRLAWPERFMPQVVP
jgi:hypothetical protein